MSGFSGTAETPKSTENMDIHINTPESMIAVVNRLLYKLKYYGINTETIQWISSFLTGRTQTVVLEGHSSDQISVDSGVPQGSVLGPILFLIYINDFHQYLKYSTLRLFADDSIIYRTIKQNQMLQNFNST